MSSRPTATRRPLLARRWGGRGRPSRSNPPPRRGPTERPPRRLGRGGGGDVEARGFGAGVGWGGGGGHAGQGAGRRRAGGVGGVRGGGRARQKSAVAARGSEDRRRGEPPVRTEMRQGDQESKRPDL